MVEMRDLLAKNVVRHIGESLVKAMEIVDRDQAIDKTADRFIKAIAKHKHWACEKVTMPL